MPLSKIQEYQLKAFRIQFECNGEIKVFVGMPAELAKLYCREKNINLYEKYFFEHMCNNSEVFGISEPTEQEIKIELGKKYLAKHKNDVEIITDGDNVPQIVIKSNDMRADYFMPDLSNFYTQVAEYFCGGKE